MLLEWRRKLLLWECVILIVLEGVSQTVSVEGAAQHPGKVDFAA